MQSVHNIHRHFIVRTLRQKRKKCKFRLGWLERLGLKRVKWLYNSTNCVIYIAVKKSNAANRHMSDIFFSACQRVSEEMEQREVPFDSVNSPL